MLDSSDDYSGLHIAQRQRNTSFTIPLSHPTSKHQGPPEVESAGLLRLLTKYKQTFLKGIRLPEFLFPGGQELHTPFLCDPPVSLLLGRSLARVTFPTPTLQGK